jgi:hypothetical protein
MSKHVQGLAAATILTMLLAACQQTTAPRTQAELVKVQLGAAGIIHAQGFTGDVPDAHYDITVRDSAGKVVAFNGTTFDPSGAGSTTLTLSHSNEFAQTLLLPKGAYSFESRVKDDASSAVLLGYGPGSENTATVDASSSVVRLKTHAVFDPASSRLAPAMPLSELYTDSTFNLGLYPKTAPVSGQSATVPTSDIGPVTYILGNSTDGVLNGAGSKIGTNVTARGTAADSELNVAASFNAWVYNSGTDTASYQPVTLSFVKSIQTNVLTADMVMPSLTVAPVATAYQDQVTTLSGSVSDDVQVQALRVYVDSNLVASTDAADQAGGAATVSTDGSGGWSAQWKPSALGTADVTVIAEDSSGNETRNEQSVTVKKQDAIIFVVPHYYSVGDVVIGDNWAAGQTKTYKLISDGSGELHFRLNQGSTHLTAISPTGNVIFDGDATGYWDFYAYDAGDYTVTITSLQDQYIELEPHLHSY